MFEIITQQATVTTVEVLTGAIVGGLISVVVTRFRERNTLEEKIVQLTKAIEDERKEVREEIALVREELMREITGLKKAESASLRHSIRNSCKRHIHEGYVYLDEKDDILACFDAYEDIVDKNGVINDCVAQMRELPNEKPSN